MRIPAAEPLRGEEPSGYEEYPASFSQSRMWFLHELEPGLTAYNLGLAWRLRGALDIAALESALTALLERHTALRTSFRMADGELRQRVHPPVPITLRPESCRGGDPDAAVSKLLEGERATPFDLTAGVLLRARLLQVAVNDCVFVLGYHHIAADGWSASVLTRDLAEFYSACLGGRRPRLPNLPVRYHDHAVWQRRELRGERLNTLREFWVQELGGVEPLELPADFPRPISPSHRGKTATFDIEADVLDSFESLCRTEGATLQMGLLSLVALVLSRYSRQRDFAIGVPVWGRSHADVENLVGLFVNTVPVRVLIDERQTFRELLQEVTRTSLRAYDHQELPFERVVDAVAPERDPTRNAIAQVLLQFDGLPPPTLATGDDLTAEAVPKVGDTTRFELEFRAQRVAPGGPLRTAITYATELFSAARIDRLTTHLKTLLTAILQAPDAPTATLGMLPSAERARIEDWQRGPVVQRPAVCVQHLFEQQVDRDPGSPALVFGPRRVSYADLDRRANRLAWHLMESGAGPGTIVGVCLQRSVESVVALLAVFKSGATYVPLDPSLPQRRLDTILDVSGAAVLLTDDAGRFRPLGISVVKADMHREQFPSTRPPSNRRAADGVAYVLFTSGSTGTPKGVEVEHPVLTNLILWQSAHPRLGRPSRTLQFAGCGFDVSLQEVFTTLATGGCLVLVDRETQRDSLLLLQHMVEHDVERVFLPFAALEQLAVTAMAHGVPKTLHDVVSAGEQLLLTPAIRQLMRSVPDCRLHNHYGPTESHVVTASQLDGDPDAWTGDEAGIGTPIANADIQVLDEHGWLCPIGVPGELHIGGLPLARGYLNDPQLTSLKFVGASGSPEGGSRRQYRSGDLARWNADGTLSFLGRIDQQVKLRGFRIEPGEVEAQLMRHSGVAQAAVVLLREGTADPRLVAYWVSGPSAGAVPEPAAAHLRAFLSEVLPDHMVPSMFVELETLPLNANGKLDRRSLPAPAPGCGANDRVRPSSDVERQLLEIWSEVLGHVMFGVTDNFFLLGGHSLAAVRLAAAIRQRFGSTMQVKQIFRRPTIAEQAFLLSGQSQTATDCPVAGASGVNLVTLQPRGQRPPLYAIHGWGGTVLQFIPLAQALSPQRPFRGVQASEFDEDAPLPALAELAAGYAEQILAGHPEGAPVHLLGHSAGGWYAHAVAHELLKRGATVGCFAVLDTGGTAHIHRSIGFVTLPLRLAPRLPRHLAELIAPPGGQRRRDYLAARFKALNRHLDTFLFHHRDFGAGLRHAAALDSEAAFESAAEDPDNDFHVVLHRGYRPPRLPVAVHVFAPPARMGFLRVLWRFYARGGVRSHLIFSDHTDFIQPERAAELARELGSALAEFD